MCGITGVVSALPLKDADISVVAEMNQRQFHRGPDSEGRFQRERVMLAMRRLSIVDLAGGQQPLFNETGDVAIVCNGEIYNHRELRQELEALGHRFSSHSDVETIVHAYEQFGNACLARLRGMFAFALWDGRHGERLLLARDRMGEKPLYLHLDAKRRLWFASELQSVALALGRPARLAPESFNLFMAFQYVPEPSCPIEGIAQLPAGHLLEIDPRRPHLRSRPYWDIRQAREDPARPVEVVERSLDQACRLMGTADVPVAVALSGGIDSSLVAALTARHYPGQIRAFCVGYQGRPEVDEREFAQSLARALGIEFTGIELDIREVVDEFPTLVAAMDTPIADIAAFGYYAVSRAARRAGYPVLLSGLGGDEFFWGYSWVREAVVRNENLLAARRRLNWVERWRKRKDPAWQPDFFGVHSDLRNGDAWSRTLMPRDAQQRLPQHAWLKQARLDLKLPVHLAVSTLLNRTWLRSNCLALADRMSMAHSVEMRLPLLDADLVDRVTGMRNMGLSDWERPHKWLLVQALKDALPEEVLSRHKRGFQPPVQQWMEGIVSRFEPLLANGALVRQGLIDRLKVQNGPLAFNLPFKYKLVLLECWARVHLEGQDAHGLQQSA